MIHTHAVYRTSGAAGTQSQGKALLKLSSGARYLLWLCLLTSYAVLRGPGGAQAQLRKISALGAYYTYYSLLLTYYGSCFYSVCSLSAHLLCRTCYISYLYVMYGYTFATAIKYLSMAILTVYSLPYELQAYTYLLYGCTCTSMMLLFYRMHNGCEYSFHGYTHELRDARGRRRPGNLNPQLVPRTLWYEWLRR